MTAQQHRPNLTWLLALTCALALSGLPQVSDAAEYLTAVAGGSGGTAFTLRCASDEILTGVRGRASSLVDRIEPRCVQVDPLGRTVGLPVDRGFAGGNGGTSFSLGCPEYHAVSGIQGKAGSVIDQLRIKCGPLASGPKLASIGSVDAGQAGGSGGNAFGPFDCVDNKPGRGLIGRAGNFVDQLRLACDFPANPLRPISAFVVGIDGSGRSITRTQIGRIAVVVLNMSSEPRGLYHVPVQNNDPTLAMTVYQGYFLGSGNPTREDIYGTNIGCASVDIGFPGSVLPRIYVLVERPGGPALTLSLSIVEWTESTTSAFGTLTTSNPAPSGGIPVTLTSSHPNLAIVPASVTIPAGTRSTTFEIRRPGTLGACIVIGASGPVVNAQSPILFRTLPSRSKETDRLFIR